MLHKFCHQSSIQPLYDKTPRSLLYEKSCLNFTGLVIWKYAELKSHYWTNRSNKTDNTKFVCFIALKCVDISRALAFLSRVWSDFEPLTTVTDSPVRKVAIGCAKSCQMTSRGVATLCIHDYLQRSPLSWKQLGLLREASVSWLVVTESSDASCPGGLETVFRRATNLGQKLTDRGVKTVQHTHISTFSVLYYINSSDQKALLQALYGCSTHICPFCPHGHLTDMCLFHTHGCLVDMCPFRACWTVSTMTAIKHALQRDIFTPNDERLLSIVNVCKAGKKKKNCFLCATGTCVRTAASEGWCRTLRWSALFQWPQRGLSRSKWWRWRSRTKGTSIRGSRRGSSEIWLWSMPKMPARSEKTSESSVFWLSPCSQDWGVFCWTCRRIQSLICILRRFTAGWPAARLRRTPSSPTSGSWTSVTWGRSWSSSTSVLSCLKVCGCSQLHLLCAFIRFSLKVLTVDLIQLAVIFLFFFFYRIQPSPEICLLLCFQNNTRLLCVLVCSDFCVNFFFILTLFPF